MKQYWVYVLLCRDGSYYVGVTSNLEQRIAQHELGAFPTCYTFERRPIKLVLAESFGSPIEAIAAEKKLKGWSHAKKDAFVRGRFELLPPLSRNRHA